MIGTSGKDLLKNCISSPYLSTLINTNINARESTFQIITIGISMPFNDIIL
jgi:hypothetical protein